MYGLEPREEWILKEMTLKGAFQNRCVCRDIDGYRRTALWAGDGGERERWVHLFGLARSATFPFLD